MSAGAGTSNRRALHSSHLGVTDGQLRWQVWTSLAYGARGLLYYSYAFPTGIMDFNKRFTFHVRVHANLAAVAPIIPVSRPSFCRVPPGMRSIHPHKCHTAARLVWIQCDVGRYPPEIALVFRERWGASWSAPVSVRVQQAPTRSYSVLLIFFGF